MTKLDKLSICAVLLAPLAIGLKLTIHGEALTVIMEEIVPSALEPDMSLGAKGTLEPTFEAWAIQKLRR